MSNSAELMTKDWIIKDKTKIEAGYVNIKDDLGGETNHGITQVLADNYKDVLKAKFNWNGKMQDLTKEMAFYLYTVDFWDKLRLNDFHAISPLLADKLFDIAINVGVRRAGEWLQTILNAMNNKGSLYKDLKVDGSIGSVTVNTIKEYINKRGTRAIARLHMALYCMQGSHYINISVSREANETFTYGWYGRMEQNIDKYFDGLWEV